MVSNVSRRTLVKSAAAASAIGASAVALGAQPSSVFAAPSLLQGAKVEVKYWTSFGSGVNGDAQTKVINDFMAANPDITITPTIHANYEDLAAALVAALQTGDEPHVAVLSDVWWFRFYLAEAIADLKPLLADAGIDTDDYVQSLYTEYTRHEGQWAVPFARSTPLLYYNEDALTAAGLDDSIFAKWSTFAESAPKLVGGKTDFAFGFGNAASYGAWVLQGPVWAFGGHYSDPDFNMLIAEPKSVAAGEFFQKMVNDKVATTTEDPVTDFQTGLTAAILGSTGSLGGIKKAATFKFGTHFLPEEEGFGCCTGGAGLSILASASDDVKAAAIKFLDFSTSTATTTEWSQTTGYMPVRTSAIESDAMVAFLKENPNSQTAINQLPKTSPQDSARVFIPNGDQILGRGWEQVLVKSTAVQDAFNEVKSELDDEKEPVLEQIQALEG
ncbi:MAG: ABC transporter substrate-binding protein [Thermomicrobiales bacterium]